MVVAVEFRLLGPVEIAKGDVVLPALRPQLQGLVSYLLLNANQHVATGRLISALWGEAEPETARAQIHAMVSKLRRTLALVGEQHRVVTGPEGYKLLAADDELDLSQFEKLVTEARRDAENDAVGCESRLIMALGLWRGNAFVGVKSAFAESRRAQLDEKRLLAQEQLGELWLDMGKHQELATELPGLYALYRGREQLARLLALALYRSGQTAAALGVLRTLREVLVAEHGIEPSRDTHLLQTAILQGDPDLDLMTAGPPEEPAVVQVPRPRKVRTPPERPAEILIGRRSELIALDQALERARARGRSAPVLVFGLPGIGKSSLVATWARKQSADFPDGVITVDLRRWDPRVAIPEARRCVLRALHVEAADMPPAGDDLADLYTATLRSAAVLVVFDHAESSAQARELLVPAGEAHCVIVSRRRLDALLVTESAPVVQVGPLRRADAIELLGRTLGATINAEQTAELARVCGDWPLALLIAVARVLAGIGGSPDLSVKELAASADRLGLLHLSEEGASLPQALDAAVSDLSVRALRLYRALGALLEPTFDISDLRDTARADNTTIAQAVEELVASSLVQRTGPTSFSVHELVRQHAAQVPAMDLNTWPFRGAASDEDDVPQHQRLGLVVDE